MRNSTELMESILTSETAQRIIEYVTPMYGEAYVCLWLFQVIGSALDEANSFPGEFIDQVTPETATWSIHFWEQEYGITPDSTLSLEERRVNVLNKIKLKTRLNPYNIEKIIENMTGIETRIDENTGKNKFDVVFLGNLRDHPEKKEEVYAFVDQIKPAHLIYEIREQLILESNLAAYTMIHFSEQESCDIFFKN